MYGAETVREFAEQLAWTRDWPLVISEHVAPGIVLVDPQHKLISVHPYSHEFRLSQNTGAFDSTVKA